MPLPSMPFETHDNIVFKPYNEALMAEDGDHRETREEMVTAKEKRAEKVLEENWREKAEQLMERHKQQNNTYYERQRLFQGEVLDISV
jgi:hypothetical protein